jgi:hypothetical protein
MNTENPSVFTFQTIDERKFRRAIDAERFFSDVKEFDDYLIDLCNNGLCGLSTDAIVLVQMVKDRFHSLVKLGDDD